MIEASHFNMILTSIQRQRINGNHGRETLIGPGLAPLLFRRV